MATLRRFLTLVTYALIVAPSLLGAQIVTVERNVNLRPDPSSQHEPLRKLEPPEVAALLNTVRVNRYYNVRTVEGLDGWVWSANVSVDLSQGFDVGPPPPPASSEYKRTDWRHWVDEDDDGQDTRQEALIRDSVDPVTFETVDEERVETGRWIGPYGGGVFTDPSDVDVDHMVPLKNAHDSGAWRWDKDKKREYANDLSDLQHLLVVEDGLNQSKGAKGPEEWMPPDASFHCEYIEVWERIKTRWHLTMTSAERAKVDDVKAGC
jgi:hypothetical protein